MKYTLQIIINQPRERVVELFDNPNNMKHWQKGFIGFVPLRGKHVEIGSKLKYHIGKRRMEIVETITSRNLSE